VGKRFLTILTHEFHQVRERKWNSERPLIFAAVVLQSTPEVRQAKDVRKRLTQRMDLWAQGSFAALCDDTEAEVRSRTASPRPSDDESQARAFHARVLSGRLRSAVRNITNREGGGVLNPDDNCTKAGRPVLEILREKHPELREPPAVGEKTGAFEPYDSVPTAVPVVITADVVETVAGKLSGAAGPGGVDAVDLRNWLLRFGKESEALREEMAQWANWLAVSNPPWAAYRALVACRLVALDKSPGTRPVGIGEIYRRLWAKCILVVAGSQATAACDNYNLCAGLAAGIEGAVHAVRHVWENPGQGPAGPPPDPPEPPDPPDSSDDDAAMTQPGQTLGTEPAEPGMGTEPAEPVDGIPPAEPEAVLLVDARNGFNELGRKAMLWTTRHRWVSGARFAFNCYRHAIQLVLRRPGDSCYILLSREGVTQGDPLAMVLYGLALVPLAEMLREAVPEVLQPWYADDAAMAGPLSGIGRATRLLAEYGPARGYFAEPAKSLLICKAAVTEADLSALAEFQFTRLEGSRYVGGFIGSPESLDRWLEPKIQDWVFGVKTLAKVAKSFPQAAYAGLAKSLQSEWQYLQRVVPGVAERFRPIEEALAGTFLPALLATAAADVAPLRDQFALSVRHAGMGIPDPTQTAERCFASSEDCASTLTASLLARETLDTHAYVIDAARRRRDLKKVREKAEAGASSVLRQAATPATARRMLRSKQTGAWLTAMPDTANGTELSVDEFRDSLRLRFGLNPAALPHRCEGCGQRFSVEHAMSCKQGGLVMQRHNDVKAEWHHLCVQALSATVVYDEPLIHISRDVREAGANGTDPAPEMRGDTGVHGFWRRGTTAIFDVRVTDTDGKSQRGMEPMAVLRRHEKAKKDKYGALCVARRRTFTPLVFSVDGMRGPECAAASKRLATLLSLKWKKTYSEVCGYVRSRLSIALVRSANRCLRSDRDPIWKNPITPWDSGSGLALYR
jgi:hypothetical protein